MNRTSPGIAIVWRGDRETRRTATPRNKSVSQDFRGTQRGWHDTRETLDYGSNYLRKRLNHARTLSASSNPGPPDAITGTMA